MDYIKKHPRIVIAVVGIFLLAAVVGITYYLTSEYGSVGPNEKIFYGTRNHLPTLNPNPQYYLTVVVAGDADLLKHLQLHFVLQYSSPNIKCMESVPGTFGTASANSSIDFMQWPKDQQKPPYAFVFALDRYQPGVCGWRISTVSYYTGNDDSERGIINNKTNIFGFDYDENKLTTKIAGGNIVCDEKLVCNYSKSFVRFGFSLPLDNYTYFLNYTKKDR